MRGRGKLPLAVAQQVSELIFESLQGEPKLLPGLERAVFLLDGSSILLAHSAESANAYPPPRNQHGASHWPVMRVLVAHEVVTGLATPPCWGPMDGPAAVSEQGVAKEMLGRLPEGCGVLGDRTAGTSRPICAPSNARSGCICSTFSPPTWRPKSWCWGWRRTICPAPS